MSHFGSKIWRCSVCQREKSWSAFTMRTNPGGARVPQNPCKQCKAQKMQEARAKNPEKYKQIQDAFHERNPEYHREWYATNQPRLREYRRELYARDLEASRARQRDSQKRYPELYAKHAATRRARQLDAFVEEIDRQLVFERDRGLCGICQSPVEGPYHIDHIIPLVKGGRHSYDNVQLAHPRCNQIKHAKFPSFSEITSG